MADVTQPGQQPMSVQDAAAKLKQTNPALAQFDDHALIGAVLKRRPDLATRISSGPAAPKTPGALQGGPGMQPIGFGQGVAQGFNPFHTPPQEIQHKLPNTKMGNAATFGEDMFNAREISQRGGSGDKAGAAGMALGTGLQWGTQGKMLEGAGKALGAGARAAEDSHMIGPAIKRAKSLAKEVGGSIDTARLATRFSQPLRSSLNKQWDAFHALMQDSLPINPKAQVLINNLRRSMTGVTKNPAIAKLANDLSVKPKGGKMIARKALEYDFAKALVDRMGKMMQGGANGEAKEWVSHVAELRDALKDEIRDLAKSKGLEPLLDDLEGTEKRVNNLERGVAGTAKQVATTADKMKGAGVGALVGAGAGTSGMGLGALLGERANAGTKFVLKPELEQEGHALAQKLKTQVSPEMFKGQGARKIAGKALENRGKYIPPAARAGAAVVAPSGQ